MGSKLETLATVLSRELGPSAIIADEAERRVYECDGLASYRSVPGLVVLVDTTAAVASVVKRCHDADIPFVARGSGTGLSGGALPSSDGVLIVLSRMTAILDIAIEDERAVVQPGVANLDVSKAVASLGYFYVPDPSSQQVCSIGGNVAENSGGAHCLKRGFTADHVTGLEVVLPDGSIERFGGVAPDPPGYDLVGVFVGSEGTLGIATEVTLRLMRTPPSVATILAGFESTAIAGAVVGRIIADGIMPSAIEMMDALAITAAEAAVHADYPDGAQAVLIVELDGVPEETVEQIAQIREHCLAGGATEIRIAKDDVERAAIWKGRKSAFAAVGRISPNYIVQDGVVPRSRLGSVLAEIAELSASTGIRVANVFHAGDGNLHPLVLFDERKGQTEAAEAVSDRIIEICLENGGSITGEHGVGADKVKHLGEMFNDVDLDTMQLVRCAFDPTGICNPGKVFPTPKLCGEATRRRDRPHPLVEAGLADAF